MWFSNVALCICIVVEEVIGLLFVFVFVFLGRFGSCFHVKIK